MAKRTASAAQVALPLEAEASAALSQSAAPAQPDADGADVASEASLQRYDWAAVGSQLARQGWGLLPGLLDAAQCQQMAAMYGEAAHFRSRIQMQRHAFGRGEYQYFAYPLPALLQALRTALYARLQPVAEQWRAQLAAAAPPWPAQHAALLAQCHAAGQRRPTPLLLRYGAGDYNCLHQDLYGALVFPLQVIVLLSHPGEDFDGGELVLTEQRPRMQSRVQVLPLQRGDAAIIAVRERPVQGTRGSYRVQHRHGVSTVLRGDRHTLGIVFHDAE
nr:2OG-Fe(II) oxygenase [Comamonas koreensis]